MASTVRRYQPYFIAYAYSQGFADPADAQAAITTDTGRFRGHLYMEWIQGQWREWAAENGVREIRSSIHGAAFGVWLASRWPSPSPAQSVAPALEGTVTTRTERAAAQVARRTQLDVRKSSVFARATDEVLFGAVFALEAKHDGGSPLDEAEQLTRGWILGEIERRHPAVDPLMDAWVESDDDPKNYSKALMAAVAAVTPIREVAVRPSLSEGAAERQEQARAAIAAARELRATVRATGERFQGRTILKGFGLAPAIPAGEIMVGDVLLFNQGGTETVTSVEPKGAASVVYRTGPADWQARTCRRTTLVAIADRPTPGV